MTMAPWIQRACQAWVRFWFNPESPDHLGLSRVLFFGALLFLYLPMEASAWGSVSAALWVPTSTFEALHLRPLSPPALAVLSAVWKVALVTSCVGIGTRLSTATAFILGFYLLGLPQNWGKIHHFDGLVVIALGILAVSRCGDAWSFDAGMGARMMKRIRERVWARMGECTEMSVKSSGRRRTNRRGRRSRVPPRPSGEYAWPRQAVQVLLATTFVSAGVAKLWISGPEWVLGDNMSLALARQHYGISNADPLVAWGLTLAQHPGLANAVAGIVLGLELAYPLALVSRSARWILVPGMIGALIGIRLLMGPTFEAFIACHVFWVRWGRVAPHLRPRTTRGVRTHA